MKDTNTSIAVVLYKSKILANGEHPLMLRVTKNRKLSYKSIGISCDPKFWDSTKSQPRKNCPNRELIETIIRKKKEEYNSRALELKSVDSDFTSASLIQKIENQVKKVSVYNFFEEVTSRLITSKQVGNAKTYKDCYRTIKNFTNGKDFTFFELDYSFLIKYETYLRGKDHAETSLSVYFRTLRALYNRAIKENVARLQDYPFKSFSVSKFNTTTRKRAISKDEIKKIEALDLSADSFLNNARQFFLFSYYCNGINFVDIAHLKWQDIIGDRLLYKRSKTGRELQFKLLQPASEIIKFWHPFTSSKPTNYIFPILDIEKHKTPTQIDNRIHKVITRVNKDLKEIANLAGIDVVLTTYVARHTFATVLKKGGTATAIISEMMGHETEAITQTYLKSFENEILDSAAQTLL